MMRQLIHDVHVYLKIQLHGALVWETSALIVGMPFLDSFFEANTMESCNEYV
jgi:hypothetical protein